MVFSFEKICHRIFEGNETKYYIQRLYRMVLWFQRVVSDFNNSKTIKEIPEIWVFAKRKLAVKKLNEMKRNFQNVLCLAYADIWSRQYQKLMSKKLKEMIRNIHAITFTFILIKKQKKKKNNQKKIAMLAWKKKQQCFFNTSETFLRIVVLLFKQWWCFFLKLLTQLYCV